MIVQNVHYAIYVKMNLGTRVYVGLIYIRYQI